MGHVELGTVLAPVPEMAGDCARISGATDIQSAGPWRTITLIRCQAGAIRPWKPTYERCPSCSRLILTPVILPDSGLGGWAWYAAGRYS